jgi:hypothetical protein
VKYICGMPGTIPNKIWLYRIVHWQNVEHILEFGLVNRNHPNANPDYVAIGHHQLIEDRKEHHVLVHGSSGLSDTLRLSDYVPFYFGGHSVMLHMIRNGYSGVKKYPQEEIVYIVSSVESIERENCEFIFSDKHAKKSMAKFYNRTQDLDKVDWDIVKKKVWHNTEDDQDRRDRKQAEFLVREQLPISAIDSIVVLTKPKEDYIQSILNKFNLNIPVFIDSRHKLYY